MNRPWTSFLKLFPKGKAKPFSSENRRWNHPSRGGFSLIESVLALGVATFAVMAVAGAISIGLNTLRSAMDQFLEARIIQKISADLKMTDFENIEAESILFDLDGFEVSSENDAGYRAAISPPNQGVTAFPGASSSISQNLAIVKVEIYRVIPGRDGVLTATFPLAVARGR